MSSVRRQISYAGSLPLLGVALIATCIPSYAEEIPSSFTWRAVEIYGNKTISDNTVLDGLPIKLGSPAVSSKEQLDQWCSSAAARLKVKSISCGTVFLRRDRAYLVLDVVEGETDAPAPTPPSVRKANAVEPVDTAVLNLASDLLETKRVRFFAGQDSSVDTANTQYLDFKDPELSAKAKELHAAASAQSNVIVNAALASTDLKEKRGATYLLNWVGKPAETIQTVHRLILDPDLEVRNEATKFVVAFISQVAAPEVLGAIQTELFLQAQMPAHTDRNKALGALQEMMVTNKAVLPVTPDQVKVLEDIVKRSHLPNISNPVRYLLQTIRTRARSTTK